MQIRDRIKELRRVKGNQLRPNPRNWRTHPAAQRDALRGLLAEIGYASALLARELPDGSLELIDGHLRAETTPDAELPVLVLDVDQAEAATLLATIDPLAAMAGQDQKLLDEVLQTAQTNNAAVQLLLDQLAAGEDEFSEDDLSQSPAEPILPDSFQVVVECRSEEQQREIYERLTAEGFACRVLTL